MDRVLLAAQLILAATFVISGSAKALSSDGMQAALAVTGLRPSAIGLLRLGIPLLELLVAVTLLLGTDGTVRLSLGLCTLLSLAFTGWVALVLSRDQKVACGCFGTASRPITRTTLARNLALTVLAAAATVLAGSTDPLQLPVTGTAILTVLGGLVLVFFGTAFRLARPALTLHWSKVDPYYTPEVS